jgi:putative salt-induced outer membrane protein YdiY
VEAENIETLQSTDLEERKLRSTVGTTDLKTIALLTTAMTLSLGSTGSAQDEKPLGWFFTTEFTAVWTGGNAESNTLGLDASMRRAWEDAELKILGGAVRSQSTLTTRTAVGTPESFTVQEEETTEKTAENFYLRGRYDRQLSSKFFTFGGVDWLRNTFAGIDSRTLVAVGAGNSWVDTDQIRLKTDYSATYTFQSDVVDNPFVKTKFPGVRATYDLWWKLTETTELSSTLIGDLNLDNTDDVRLDFTNALPIAISSRLAFKPSLQLLWRNDPSLAEVPLFASDGTPAAQPVTVQLQKLDSFFKIALVVKL